MDIRKYCCSPLGDFSSSCPVSRSMHSCPEPISGLHEYSPAKTSASATSSPVLRAALSRSPAKGWLEMSILRQFEQSSNSSQEVSQSVGRGFRGQPDHVVFCLSQAPTRRQLLLSSIPPFCCRYFLLAVSNKG